MQIGDVELTITAEELTTLLDEALQMSEGDIATLKPAMVESESMRDYLENSMSIGRILGLRTQIVGAFGAGYYVGASAHHRRQMEAARAMLTEATGDDLLLVRLREEREKLREALQNMLGAFDNPICRRRYSDDFTMEAVASARAALDPQPTTTGTGERAGEEVSGDG